MWGKLQKIDVRNSKNANLRTKRVEGLFIRQGLPANAMESLPVSKQTSKPAKTENSVKVTCNGQQICANGESRS